MRAGEDHITCHHYFPKTGRAQGLNCKLRRRRLRHVINSKLKTTGAVLVFSLSPLNNKLLFVPLLCSPFSSQTFSFSFSPTRRCCSTLPSLSPSSRTRTLAELEAVASQRIQTPGGRAAGRSGRRRTRADDLASRVSCWRFSFRLPDPRARGGILGRFFFSVAAIYGRGIWVGASLIRCADLLVVWQGGRGFACRR